MTTTPWSDLLTRLGQRRTRARWQEMLGAHFEQVFPYLQRTGAPVHYVACSECGCNHKVLPERDSGFYAVCTCEACDCEDIPLTPEEAEAWLFDPLLFGRAMQSALGTCGDVCLTGGNMLDLGMCPQHETSGHAFLLFGEIHEALRSVPDLAVRKDAGCVLFAPVFGAAKKLLSASHTPGILISEACKSLAQGTHAMCKGACKLFPRELSHREMIEQLRPPILELSRDNRELANQVAEGHEELARVFTDPTGTLSRIAAGFSNEEDRNLFYLLICTEEKRGRQQALSYQAIGQRMSGISKQAVLKRVQKFKRSYPKPWQYVQGVRKPPKQRHYSEIGPKARRQTGIDENYGYGN